MIAERETTLNPIVYEVLRNRLLAITQEMRVALQSVSGSPTVTEASDFFTGIFTPDGSFASMGFQVAFEAPVVGALIRYVCARRGNDVHDGDMFVGNDPYVGALHQNDVQLAGPIYVDGEILAWAGVMAHETDMGGMDFASWSPKAREIYQEGLRIPAVKLVDAGRTREDVLEMILTASRLPDPLALDIRAFIATLNVARERLQALARRYGAAAIAQAMRRMIDGSETRARARLRELPDGRFRASDFLEHDGHENRLYRVDCVLQKRGDTLRFDFGGSSLQAPGFINATRAGLHGGVAGALLPTLGFDIAWNAGILRPVEIVAPDGLICTAVHPAPVGSATVETIWVVSNVVTALMAKLFACGPAPYRERAQAVSTGTMATFNLGGRNQFGEPFGLHLMDPLAGGSGAFAARDGVDGGGPINTPAPSIADVERNERSAPLFYVYRRRSPDTGGAGRRRGGCSMEIALTLAGIDEALALIMTHGAEVPNASGIGGGYPGATVRQSLARDTMREGRVEGDLAVAPFGPKPGLMTMTSHDAFVVSWQGGGGCGDPLEREPERVAHDVAEGTVSAAAANELYGVVVTRDGLPDAAATAQRRDVLVRARLRGSTGDVERLSAERLAGAVPLAESLVVAADDEAGFIVATTAGAIVARGTTCWRAGAVALAGAPEHATRIRLHERLTITRFFCPLSGRLLAFDVHERNEKPVDDVDLAAPAVIAMLAAHAG